MVPRGSFLLEQFQGGINAPVFDISLYLFHGKPQFPQIAYYIQAPQVLGSVNAVAVKGPAGDQYAQLLIIAQNIRTYVVKGCNLPDFIKC